MKIYTRTGDDGTTGLLGPGRVLKSAPRVEAYGAVDEFNATLAVVRTHDGGGWFTADLDAIQPALFEIGAELATVTARGPAPAATSDDDIAAIERRIDALEAELPPLTRFILPGGTPLAAALHVARTVCRRAERRVVALSQIEASPAIAVRYLNRVADLMFVMSRVANHRAGHPDREWNPAPR